MQSESSIYAKCPLRSGHNKLGVLTFNYISVIDYSNTAGEVVKRIKDVFVSELDPIFSDGHILLSTKFSFKQMKHETSKIVGFKIK